MKVNIIDGRKEKSFEQSTKVLVDVFRSTSTMPIILTRGAEKIIPTSSVSDARELKRKNPEFLVVGERYGMKVPGFDMNNSPSDAMNAQLEGKTVIFTSTNGTKVLKKIYPTGKVYISSFINFTSTYEKIKGLDRVDIIVSNRPDGPADEDYIYAEFMRDWLLGKNPPFEKAADRIRKSKGSTRLKLMGSRKDIEASLAMDFCKKAIIFQGPYIITEE